MPRAITHCQGISSGNGRAPGAARTGPGAAPASAPASASAPVWGGGLRLGASDFEFRVSSRCLGLRVSSFEFRPLCAEGGSAVADADTGSITPAESLYLHQRESLWRYVDTQQLPIQIQAAVRGGAFRFWASGFVFRVWCVRRGFQRQPLNTAACICIGCWSERACICVRRSFQVLGFEFWVSGFGLSVFLVQG